MNFNKHIESLKVYEAGKPIELVVREFGIDPKSVIKLASNENPLGCAPAVSERIREVALSASLYPDDSYFELKAALANLHGVESKNIIIGSGSDQIIEFVIHSKCNEKKGILVAGTTFAMYEIYASHIDAPLFKTPSHHHDLAEFREMVKENAANIGVVFLCVPNNPLGECLGEREVLEFVEFVASVNSEILVVIDGAYSEFAKFKDEKKAVTPASVVSFDNAIFLGTFSKAYGLGGMRVGYGVANPNITSSLHKVRAPFNITTLSLAAAVYACKEQDFITQTLKNNAEQMRIYEEFCRQNGLKFIDSYTNFITIFFEKDTNLICERLLKKGIILRNLKSYGLNAIRITVGRADQNERVLAELAKEL